MLASVLPAECPIDERWARFLSYAAASSIPLLAWKQRAGLAVSIAMAILAVGLESLHALTHGTSLQLHGAVMNLLGVVGGILLGLNLRMLRTPSKDEKIATNQARD